MGIPFSTSETFEYRLVRVELSTGETEVLLTTLTDQKKYPAREFGPLYNCRWGVETCFFLLKSLLQLARFSAVTVNNAWQDIYATLIGYNFLSAIHHSMLVPYLYESITKGYCPALTIFPAFTRPPLLITSQKYIPGSKDSVSISVTPKVNLTSRKRFPIWL